MDLQFYKTKTGQIKIVFKDQYGRKCFLQESVKEKDSVYIGIEILNKPVRLLLTKEMAQKIGKFLIFFANNGKLL